MDPDFWRNPWRYARELRERCERMKKEKLR